MRTFVEDQERERKRLLWKTKAVSVRPFHSLVLSPDPFSVLQATKSWGESLSLHFECTISPLSLPPLSIPLSLPPTSLSPSLYPSLPPSLPPLSLSLSPSSSSLLSLPPSLPPPPPTPYLQLASHKHVKVELDRCSSTVRHHCRGRHTNLIIHVLPVVIGSMITSL